ncbi:MAG TPA: bifunctional demethylmenaquinone methyltransferase/2-methoxy-6-polyprenyl-1,4-benzoquinol methylase UbiE [Fimbriimonas sp.]
MPARADEAIWQTEGARKRTAVQRMFGEIAPTYDLLNGLMSLSLHRRWRAFAVGKLALKPGARALDVCCGTGDFMVPLRKAVGSQGRVVGIDFCLPMLEVAKRKLFSPPPTPSPSRLQRDEEGGLALGDACQLPVRSGSFDAVSVGWGIRNVPDIDAAHRELVRVLRNGGRFVSLDMARPENPAVRVVSEFVFQKIVPKLGSLFGKTDAYTYLPKSTERFWTREQLAASMERAGLVDVGHRNLMLGNICIHWGRKP